MVSQLDYCKPVLVYTLTSKSKVFAVSSCGMPSELVGEREVLLQIQVRALVVQSSVC